MKDWKGNDIKPGDTVVHVRVKKLPITTKLVVLDFENDTINVVGTNDTPAKDYDWEVVGEREVVSLDGRMYFQHTGTDGIVYRIDTSIGDFMADPVLAGTEILCIKGVSDNETEYYLNYFK